MHKLSWTWPGSTVDQVGSYTTTIFALNCLPGEVSNGTEVNPSLLASSVLANPRVGEEVRICTRCMTADHSAAECALASLEVPRSQPFPSPNPPPRANLTHRAVNPYPSMGRASFDEPCHRFNRGSCSSKTCRYEHTCSACFKGAHPAIECKPKESRTRPQVSGEDPMKGKSATP